MLRTLLPLTFLAMMMVSAPFAAAEDDAKTNETQPDEGEQAWVDDCPPDRMCAYSGSEGNTSADEPTYDGRCDGEVCAYGEEECIECSGPVSNDGSTCMDGQQEGETCDEEVYYMDGPNRGPADGVCENCRGDTAEPALEADPISAPAEETASDHAQNTVPGLALVGLVGAGALAALLVARRH